MDRLSVSDIVKVVDAMCDIIIKNEVYFCELDSAAGDGDFGMSLAKGFKVLKTEFNGLPTDDIGKFLNECGKLIAEHCGGASGPIWGSAFRSAGKYGNEKKELTLKELSELMQSAVEGIQKRGGAKLGDKTLLDALIPAIESLKKSAEAGEDILEAIKKSTERAKDGAERTKYIIASKGRASYLGERSINYPDAGAMAIAIIFKQLIEKFCSESSRQKTAANGM